MWKNGLVSAFNELNNYNLNQDLGQGAESVVTGQSLYFSGIDMKSNARSHMYTKQQTHMDMLSHK